MRPGKRAGNARLIRVVASAAIVAAAILIGAGLVGNGPVMQLADIYWTYLGH